MTDLFNEKAKDWDANEMRTILSSAIGSAILEHVSLHDQMRVMDFGAGYRVDYFPSRTVSKKDSCSRYIRSYVK